SAVDLDETAMIAHQAWTGPESYLIRLFRGARPTWFAKYGRLHGFNVPPALKPLLIVTNGCFMFGMSLFGMTPSMLRNPPLLDRSRVQCHDLSLANRSWKIEYRAPADHFHFGCRYF